MLPCKNRNHGDREKYVGTETGFGSDFGWSQNLYLTQEYHDPDSKIKFYGNRTSDGRFRSKNRFCGFTALHDGKLVKNLPKKFEFLARDIWAVWGSSRCTESSPCGASMFWRSGRPSARWYEGFMDASGVKTDLETTFDQRIYPHQPTCFLGFTEQGFQHSR